MLVIERLSSRCSACAADAGVPVFLYQFTHPLDHARAHRLGATHRVELFFVWGNSEMGIALSQSERPLSVRIQRAWGRFARCADPSDSSLTWPRYSRSGESHLVLDLEPQLGTQIKQPECDFWDRFDRSGEP